MKIENITGNKKQFLDFMFNALLKILLMKTKT